MNLHLIVVILRAFFHCTHSVRSAGFAYLLDPGSQKVQAVFACSSRECTCPERAKDCTGERQSPIGVFRPGRQPQLLLAVCRWMAGRFFLRARRLHKARPFHFFCHGGQGGLVPGFS